MSSDVDNDFFSRIESNPLLNGLPEVMTLQQWGAALRYDPRSEWRQDRRLNLNQVVLAAEQIKRLFVPTQPTVEIAWRLQGLLMTGLIARDPRSSGNKRRIYEIAALRGMPVSKAPWFPEYASGMMIRGITRQGKSHIIQRTISQFPQVIERFSDESAGWTSLKQLVYLVVPMPADASRKGFLLSAFQAIDQAIGTLYASQFAKSSSSVETQLVHLAALLAMHRCGLLIIEEAQEENIAGSVYGSEFVTFFLRVLNFGVPVVMVGNPKAFERIEQHSQNLARLSEGGAFTLEPAPSPSSNIWRLDFVPGIWGWNILPEPDEIIPNLDEYLWRATGGFPDFLARLRKESLINAARAGANCVMMTHVEKAKASASMAEVAPLIDAFSQKSIGLLRRFGDIPHEYFDAKWRLEARSVEAVPQKNEAGEDMFLGKSKTGQSVADGDIKKARSSVRRGASKGGRGKRPISDGAPSTQDGITLEEMIEAIKRDKNKSAQE